MAQLLTGVVAFTIRGGWGVLLKGTALQWFKPDKWMGWDRVMWVLADGRVGKERPRRRGGGRGGGREGREGGGRRGGGGAGGG